MNAQPRNKVLIIIIGILLIANIATLSFFLLNKKDRPARSDRKAQITAFLKNDVGFTNTQLNLYDTLSKEHRASLKGMLDEISFGRENILKELASREFSDSGMDIAVKKIEDYQNDFEMKMLRHLKDIRNICTPAQKPVFDAGFYKIIARRGEGRKDNDRKQ